MIIQKLNLNLIPDGSTPVIYASQADDNGRQLKCYLYFNGEPYEFVRNTTSFKLRGTRPDGQKLETILNKYQNKYVYTNLTDDFTEVAGDVYCNIEMIENETNRTGSQAFILRVQPQARGEIE